MITKDIVKGYLKDKYGEVEILNLEELGSGWHGTGYKLEFKHKGEIKKVLVKSLRPWLLGHDYAADRAGVFLLQHEQSKIVPNHENCIDVVGIKDDGNLIISECKDFFQVKEFISGEFYFQDLDRVFKDGITEKDKERAIMIAEYLANMHKMEFSGSEEKRSSLLLRHTRDCVGHGETLMGVIDSYPAEYQEMMINILKKVVEYREKHKNDRKKIVCCHGDFHPGNIVFNEAIVMLDSARVIWGEPADDVTSILMNFIWYALRKEGTYTGDFKELGDIFWNKYIELTGDKDIIKIAPIYFAFRGLVVGHPDFYPDQTEETRKKLYNFVENVQNGFEYEKINDLFN